MNSRKKNGGHNTPNRSIIYPTSRRVVWTKIVNKQLVRIPSYIREKFLAWAMIIERVGIEEARKTPGYHDEPLKGDRKGQRSVRLNRSYRVIYTENTLKNINIIEVLEVSKHEY